ncbi:hypothetical protein AB0K09_01165 [Streptomyces sp. NPDC049577]|uniref:hypothetical protein n=1 Tax=Streptomyces sp. NPDC049577 TaxID=3155153 RepID=UPI00342D6339
MTTPPTAAPDAATPQKRPVPPGMAIAALSLPVMTVAGVVGSQHARDVLNDWSWQEHLEHSHMPFSLKEFVAGSLWGTLGVAAVVVCLLVGVWIHRRDGVPPWRRWPGVVALVLVWPNIATTLMELLTLHDAYSWGAFMADH